MSRSATQAAPAKSTSPKTATMTDEAVAARTGKTWGQWFAILDEAGGAQLERREIIALLGEHEVGPIWRQMVAAGYERHLGGGAKKPAPVKKPVVGPLSVNVTRLVAATMEASYNAWEKPTRRKRFFTEEISFATRRDGKTLKFGWKADASRVSIVFTPRSKTRTQVTIDHEKLKDPDDVERLLAFWTETLDRMQALLEKDSD